MVSCEKIMGTSCLRYLSIISLIVSVALLPEIAARAQPSQPLDRFLLSGDGEIRLSHEKTGRGERIRYRLADGSYPSEARRRIDRLFGVTPGSDDQISLRLVSLLDHFEDRFDQPIKIISGYRSPQYNNNLRARGRLAAKASLHIEGMAADIRLPRRLAAWAFESVKGMNCCGVGYYHGTSLHLDTGPARYWDERSSKVKTNISEHNKRIMVRTDKDIYRAGERVAVRLARITDYPLGVAPELALVDDARTLAALATEGASGDCHTVATPGQRTFYLTLPAALTTTGKSRLRVRFCAKPFPEMPDWIESNPIVIQP
jgi:uncharacterized protein YcbK (DUF882 family)